MTSDSGPSRAASPSPSPSAATPSRPARKPRVALLVATAGGLGYLPVAPGTFGALAGLMVALIPFQILRLMGASGFQSVAVDGMWVDPLLVMQTGIALFLALLGVAVSSRASRYWQQKDPRRAVIDEVSGQHLALLLGSILPVWGAHLTRSWAPSAFGFITYQSVLRWKYLLLGFILFRVLDIWKPFPARQAESFRGGWGIMADDWVAGIYAALLLWAARGFGL